MREFDTRENYLDSEGNPLVGRLKFCKLHTNTPEAIYNSQGNILANPVFTNDIGQTEEQVFLDDTIDYTVYFDKYIGHGDMAVDSDPQNWLFQYSADALSLKLNLTIETSAIQTVNNISDLRALDPSVIEERDNKKIIALAGYNTVGDKPLVYYVWNSSDTTADNGGNIIKANDISAGRWNLVNLFDINNGVDVRHFGVFPANSASAATDNQSNMIYAAKEYANSIGKPVYFPGTGFYKINNQVITAAIFEKNTYIVGKTGTASTITLINNENNYPLVDTNSTRAAVFTLTGKTVRTSWGLNSTYVIFNPTENLIIDSAINSTNKTFENINVYVDEYIGSITFDNCNIVSNGKLTTYNTFKNCRITQRMFDPDVDMSSQTVDNDCVIDIDDWTSMYNWVLLRKQQTNNTVIDCNYKTLDNSCVFNTFTNSITVINAVFDNWSVPSMIVKMVNCSGDFNWTNLSLIPTIAIEKSNVTMNSQPAYIAGITLADSTLTATNTITASLAGLSNYTLHTTSITAGTFIAKNGKLDCSVVCSSPDISDSDIVGAVTCASPKLKNCVIHYNIDQTATSASISFNIDNCTFTDQGIHNLSSNTANSQITSGSGWSNNVNNTTRHFIFIDRTNIDSDESNHSYYYDNNTGKYTLQRLAAKWSDTASFANNVAAKTIEYKTGYGLGDSYFGTTMLYFMGQFNSDNITDVNCYLTQVDMFSVGTTNIGNVHFMASLPSTLTTTNNKKIVVNGQSWWNSLNEDENYDSNAGDIMRKGIVHVGGYSWRICQAVWFANACVGHTNDMAYWPTVTMQYEIKSH